jgi:hypothetical protein
MYLGLLLESGLGPWEFLGGFFGKKTQKRRKKGKQWKQATKKNQKNWLLGAVPSAAQKWKDKEGVIKPWLLKVI